MIHPAREQIMEMDASGPLDARAALDEAVSRYETPLLRYAGQLLGRGAEQEAEDLVQETFLRFYRQTARDGTGSVRNVSTWLFRVTHNLAMDSFRSRSKRVAGEGRETPQAPADALEEMMHREACDKAMSELHRLPEEQRQVLLLRVVHGMKLREISEVTGLTTGNAGYRISQGLQELARRLKAGGVI